MKPHRITIDAPPASVLLDDACAICGASTGFIYGPPSQPLWERRCRDHTPAWARPHREATHARAQAIRALAADEEACAA